MVSACICCCLCILVCIRPSLGRFTPLKKENIEYSFFSFSQYLGSNWGTVLLFSNFDIIGRKTENVKIRRKKVCKICWVVAHLKVFPDQVVFIALIYFVLFETVKKNLLTEYISIINGTEHRSTFF